MVEKDQQKGFLVILLFKVSIKHDDCSNLFNDKVQEDLAASFPLINELKNKDGAWSYNYHDLVEMVIPIGKKDSHLDSLIFLFFGSSIGDRQLIITSVDYSEKWDNSFTGYLFYKEIDGSNVLITIKRGPEKWEVVKKSKVRGKYFTLKDFKGKCRGKRNGISC